MWAYFTRSSTAMSPGWVGGGGGVFQTHNIIQIHNSVKWDGQATAEYFIIHAEYKEYSFE